MFSKILEKVSLFNSIRLTFQVNIMVPVIVTIGATYLVISPFVTSDLQPEFIFSLALAGSSFIFYVPFVKWNWGGRFFGKKIINMYFLLGAKNLWLDTENVIKS